VYLNEFDQVTDPGLQVVNLGLCVEGVKDVIVRPAYVRYVGRKFDWHYVLRSSELPA